VRNDLRGGCNPKGWEWAAPLTCLIQKPYSFFFKKDKLNLIYHIILRFGIYFILVLFVCLFGN